MLLIWSWLKLVLFRLDAERVHRWSVGFLRIFSRTPARRRVLSVLSRANALPVPPPIEVAGLRFRSRLGLAAGFDKDAEIVEALPYLGFGFAEIGTVTPLPQAGNSRPRLFRDAEKKALFNRMGFNGAGAEVVAAHLTQARLSGALPMHFRVGLNVGKNKDTPAERAHEDYARALEPFPGLVDYVVVNVSSPNTPGLRALQATEPLQRIAEAVQSSLASWKSAPPVFFKLAPELEPALFSEILAQGPSWGVKGWVLTNTWAGEWKKNAGSPALPGGWSGSILTRPSLERLKLARSLTSLPIISVGGILSVEDARERVRHGADLVQIYTGWIYGGPTFPSAIARALSVPFAGE